MLDVNKTVTDATRRVERGEAPLPSAGRELAAGRLAGVEGGSERRAGTPADDALTEERRGVATADGADWTRGVVTADEKTERAG